MKLLLSILTLVLLAACGSGPSSSGPTTEGGAGDPFGTAIWQLTTGTVDGASLTLLDTHPVTLTAVDGGALSGTAACNRYGGAYTIDGDALTVGPMSATEMACSPDAAMQLEAAYLNALGRATSARIDGADLVLSGDGVELRFAAGQPEPAAALVGTVWTLESLLAGDTVSSPVPGLTGTEATLTLDDADGDGTGTIAGSSGCNGFGGTVTIEADRLIVAELASTLIGCEPALAAQEATIVTVLDGSPTWSIDGPLLTLQLPDGTGLQYRASAGQQEAG